MERFNLLNLIKRISNRWLSIVALMIIGGFAGLVISRFVHPIYESTAVFSVTIDYTQTGALTDIQEDQMMRSVGSVLMSDEVILQTLSQLKNLTNIKLNQPEFLKDASMDREEFRWTIRFRNKDRTHASSVMRIWAETADEIISQALIHADTSKVLTESMHAFIDDLRASSFSNSDYPNSYNPSEMVKVIGDLSGQIQTQKQKSLGLFHALSVIQINGAEPAQSPILGQRNIFAISGLLIGLISGLIFAAVPATEWS